MTHEMDRFRITEASIRVDTIPPAGRTLDLSVPDEERATIAERVGVEAVERLRVKLQAVRFRGGIRITGRLEARVVQLSAVTLEPLTQTIDEPVDRIFLPGGEKPYAGAANAEIFVDLEGEDLPDHFDGNEADFTDMIVEELALAIDPYPREAGEAVATEAVPGAAEEEVRADSPFAALGALKGSSGEGSSGKG